eukprot:1592375-Pleurochrysis_carterae.AAC.1
MTTHACTLGGSETFGARKDFCATRWEARSSRAQILKKINEKRLLTASLASALELDSLLSASIALARVEILQGNQSVAPMLFQLYDPRKTAFHF